MRSDLRLQVEFMAPSQTDGGRGKGRSVVDRDPESLGCGTQMHHSQPEWRNW